VGGFCGPERENGQILGLLVDLFCIRWTLLHIYTTPTKQNHFRDRQVEANWITPCTKALQVFWFFYFYFWGAQLSQSM